MTQEKTDTCKQLCEKMIGKYPEYNTEYLLNQRLRKLDIYQKILSDILYNFNKKILESLSLYNIQVHSYIEEDEGSCIEDKYSTKFDIYFNFKHKSKNPFRDWDCLPLSAITSIEDLDDITIQQLHSSLSCQSDEASWKIKFCIPTEFFEEFKAILFANISNIFTNIKFDYDRLIYYDYDYINKNDI